MKTREQNRNNKRTEIERFDWFIERTDKRAWLLIGEANARVNCNSESNFPKLRATKA